MIQDMSVGCNHEWTSHTGQDGTWSGWGTGKMDYRECSRCKCIDYLVFTPVLGEAIDIRKLFDLDGPTGGMKSSTRIEVMGFSALERVR